MDPLSARPVPWRLFWLLFVAGILSILAIIPLAIDLFGSMTSSVELPAALPILIIIGIVQNLALLALIVWLGLKLSRKLGLRAPLLESLVSDSSAQASVGQTLLPGLLIGVAVGLLLLVVLLGLVPRLPDLPFVAAARLPLWKRFLACFYGGIYEELLARLFLLSLFAWIFNRSWRKPVPRLSSSGFWFANIVVAILFGLGHLPSASLVMAITPLVIAAALLLNGIAALAFGYLFRTRGLEAAMVAHFTGDFIIYVLGPGLLRQ